MFANTAVADQSGGYALIKRKAVVDAGGFENDAGDIWLLRYDHVEQLF